MKYASIGSPGGYRPASCTSEVAADPRAGFTLLETMTALTILAISFVGLYEAHTSAMRTASTAADSTRARIIAQSLLAEATSGWNAHPSSRSGSDGRFRWSVVVARENAPWADIKSDHWRLNRIRVSVAWDLARRVELETLKLGRADE